MKFGMRKPSLAKSFKARTTAKYKRKVKKALIPGYGKKAWGWLKIRKKQFTTKFIRKHISQFGICLNKTIMSNVLNLNKSWAGGFYGIIR